VRNRELHLLTDNIIFGEGPRWHQGRLWFSDIKDHRVKAIDEKGNLETIVALDGDPSGLGWLPNGQLLVVSMLDHRLLRWDSNRLVEVANLSAFCGGLLNDMVVDSVGRAYIGNVGFDSEAIPLVLKTTNLMRVNPDGQACVVAADVMCPNGMAITPDGKTLLVAQSASTDLLAFDIDGNGDLHNRRIYATLPNGVTSDGICLDAENALWVACPTSNEFLRVKEGGVITDRIDSGNAAAVACMLGGEDRKTLFCLTSMASLHTANQLGDSQIFLTKVDIPGAGRP
jgi:sugar lactone lactonase YvrE